MGQAASEAKGLTEQGGPAADTFEQLGIKLVDASGKTRSTNAVFQEAVQRLSEIKDPAERAAAASKLFGERAGPELSNAISQGAAGLTKYREDLRQSGALITTELADKAEAAGTTLSNFGDRVTKALQIGALEGFTSNFGELSQILKDPKVTKGIQIIGEGLGLIAGGVLKAIGKLPALIKALTNLGESIGETFSAIRERVMAFVEFFRTLPDTLIGIAKDMGEQLKAAMLGPLDDLVSGAKDAASGVVSWFTDMKDKVVGNSIVPDMMDLLEQEFGRLDRIMVQPTEDAAARASAAFEELQRSTSAPTAGGFGVIGPPLSALVGQDRDNQGALPRVSTQADEAAKRVKTMADVITGSAREAGRSIQRSLADTIEGLFRGKLDSVQDFFRSVVDIALRAFSEIAAQALVTPVVGSSFSVVEVPE